jgi:hypothetical protein
LACGLAAAACTSPSGAMPASGSPASGSAANASGIPRPDHVVVVVLENKDSSSILRAPDVPYLRSLASRSAVFTNSHAVARPSQPNYLALFSGDTHGVESNDCPLSFSEPNLARELLDAGLSFGGFSEDLPSTGFAGCETAGYARKHNPWVNFTNLPESVNRPFMDFGPDYLTLPTVSFVIPNLCNDMHDCSVTTGDMWLRQNIQPYEDWASSHNSLLIVTFDEADESASKESDSNQIATLFSGSMVNPGTYPQRIDHYGVLRAIEDAYRLTHVGRSASARPITDVWRTG